MKKPPLFSLVFMYAGDELKAEPFAQQAGGWTPSLRGGFQEGAVG